MTNVTPKSNMVYTTKHEANDTIDSTIFKLAFADSCGIKITTVSDYTMPMFPDRFMPVSTFKLILNKKNENCILGHWIFKDSLKTINAFFNWLDCFGENNKPVKFGEERVIQKTSFIVFLNDTSLTYLSSDKPLDFQKWQCCLEKHFGIHSWDVVVIQEPRKKARWMRYLSMPETKEIKLIPLPPHNAN
jgi:hypothetical protein